MGDIKQGEFLKKLVEERFSSTSEFSKRVKKSRTWIQGLYNYDELSMKVLKQLAPVLGVEPLDIIQCNFNVIKVGSIAAEPSIHYGADIKPNITYIPFPAQAGKLIGFGDTEIKEGDNFEKFRLPGLNNGSYLAFPISGESMNPVFKNGDIIICKKVEQLEYIKEGVPYAFLLDDSEGFVVKTVTRNTDKRSFTFNSYARHFPPFKIDFKKVKSVWYIVDSIMRDPVSRFTIK